MPCTARRDVASQPVGAEPVRARRRLEHVAADVRHGRAVWDRRPEHACRRLRELREALVRERRGPLSQAEPDLVVDQHRRVALAVELDRVRFVVRDEVREHRQQREKRDHAPVRRSRGAGAEAPARRGARLAALHAFDFPKLMRGSTIASARSASRMPTSVRNEARREEREHHRVVAREHGLVAELADARESRRCAR